MNTATCSEALLLFYMKASNALRLRLYLPALLPVREPRPLHLQYASTTTLVKPMMLSLLSYQSIISIRKRNIGNSVSERLRILSLVNLRVCIGLGCSLAAGLAAVPQSLLLKKNASKNFYAESGYITATIMSALSLGRSCRSVGKSKDACGQPVLAQSACNFLILSWSTYNLRRLAWSQRT